MSNTPAVTPAHRFALVAMKTGAERTQGAASPLVRGLRAAHLWESFPGSYTPAQVAAAVTLLVECTPGAASPADVADFGAFDDAFEAVLALVA